METISLNDIPLLWRAESLAPLRGERIPTGFNELDQALGGGWPEPALIELLCDHYGIGELRLLLGILSGSADGRKIVLWLSPPFDVHAIALLQHGLQPGNHWICMASNAADFQWAMTQGLRSGACQAVIGWPPRIGAAALRTLKLAAHSGRTIGVLFRPLSAASSASPANIRLQLQVDAGSLEVSVLKVQGRRPSTIHLDMESRTNQPAAE